MYEALTFCLIGAIIGYLSGFLYQILRSKDWNKKLLSFNRNMTSYWRLSRNKLIKGSINRLDLIVYITKSQRTESGLVIFRVTLSGCICLTAFITPLYLYIGGIMYYNGAGVLNSGCPINFSIGNRSTGKSFYWKRYCIKRFIEAGKQFIYIRRNIVDIDVVKIHGLMISGRSFPDTVSTQKIMNFI